MLEQKCQKIQQQYKEEQKLQAYLKEVAKACCIE